MNSCVMNKCPAIFEHYYNIKNIQYYTRQVGDLDVPSSRTGYGDRSLKVDGAKKWTMWTPTWNHIEMLIYLLYCVCYHVPYKLSVIKLLLLLLHSLAMILPDFLECPDSQTAYYTWHNDRSLDECYLNDHSFIPCAVCTISTKCYVKDEIYPY